MGGINLNRWFLGGIVAAVVIWLIEGGASTLYMDDVQAALSAHSLSMEMTSGVVLLSVVLSLLVGLALIFFYAAARPRFGPGPRTAFIVAVAMWAGGYLPALAGYVMIGLYPQSMVMLWGAIGLIELIIAALLGGWVYREGGTAPAM
ncbi:MAG: hypothetical protein ACT4PM_04215 [Gemmatimonadales bacterium]